MKIREKFIFVAFLFFVAFILNGCDKKILYPEADVRVTKVEPHNILPTSNDLSSVEDGVISLQIVNSIPCNLIRYDLIYRTVQGEPIDGIGISNININLPLSESGTDVELTLKPYTQQLFDLFTNSVSNISPVRCVALLYFKDSNNNEIIKEAGFLLHKYVETASSE